MVCTEVNAQRAEMWLPEFNAVADAHLGPGFMIFSTAGQPQGLKEHYNKTRLGIDAGLKFHFRIDNRLWLGLKGTYFSSSNTTENVIAQMPNGSRLSGELKDQYQLIFSGISAAFNVADNGNVRFDLVFAMGPCFFRNDGIFVVDTFRLTSVSTAYEMGVNAVIRLSEHLSLISEIRYTSSIAYNLQFQYSSSSPPLYFRELWDLTRLNMGIGLRYAFWKRKKQVRPLPQSPGFEDEYVPNHSE